LTPLESRRGGCRYVIRYNLFMAPRIAIPIPHFGDPEYAERSLPQYESAVRMAGGEPVRIPLDQSPAETMKLIEHCDAVLLPGSPADVDPAKYGAARNILSAAADSRRDTVDELLLQDAYNMHKPILGICYGLQILNVYRSGTLVQHIESKINHEAGKKVAIAHTVEIDPTSKLARIVSPSKIGEEPGLSRAVKTNADSGASAPVERFLPVNSSHHQSAEIIGDGLRVVARCPDDRVIEAVEGTSPDHFVLAVQWHPERSVDEDKASRSIFKALVEAAEISHAKLVGEFEAT
jgi:putative glutamine amidotransferase